MPVINPKLHTPLVDQPSPVMIAKPAYRGVTVDTQYVPQSSLLTAIEGSSWTVNYYSQVLDDDNALSGQQVDREAIYQQYRLIIRLELKVTQPLTASQDQESKQTQVTGTAVTYPFLIPVEGDMFLADIGDGREGVFRITGTEKRTYFKESCYQIEYTLVDYSTEQRRGDLDRKVVLELYFERDFLIHGQNPLLLRQDYADVQFLTDKYYEILQIYFAMFASNEFKTLLVPGQRRPVYDHFLMKAVTGFFETTQAPALVQMRILNVDDSDVLRCFTLWDALALRQKSLLPFINRRTGLLTTRVFTRRPRLEGIRYSGIDYVVYPKDPEVCVNYDILPTRIRASADHALRPVPARAGALDQVLQHKARQDLPYGNAPLVHDVLVDDYYVFSEAFYTNGDGQSQLELLVRDYLDLKAVSRRTLVLMSETWHAFGALERFYYLPILLLLIRSTIRSI
ncbi:hypothetical protein [Paraburkholderia sediminicola]|uniref:hypothetical protein n=1 Tax=Paraburkholderia sediminicola TaxID=458836 RepID=UPI0038B903AE